MLSVMLLLTIITLILLFHLHIADWFLDWKKWKWIRN